MPVTANQGVELYYDVDGEGSGDASEELLPVVFVGTVGFGAWQWCVQHPAVAGPRRTVVWDLRGTGRSGTPPGPYGVDDLAGDLEAVLADAGLRAVHVVGAGLGGMVALRYAREYGRASSLVLFATAASGDDVDEAALRALYPTDRTRETLRDSLAGAFSETFRTDHAEFAAQIADWRLVEDAPPDAVDAQVAALHSFSAGPTYDVTIPTLVGNGVDDPVLAPDAGEDLAADLPRGEYVPIAGRHLAFLEAGTAVNDRLLDFFAAVETGMLE